MPLRDHFRPPLDDLTSWEDFHGQWPGMIVQSLARTLPRRYVAAPRVHFGSAIEIDVATYEQDAADTSPPNANNGNGAAVATAVWAPPQPTLTIATELPDLDEYEVRIYDSKRGRRLVAAIEIVSPANKDRPEHRRAFVVKCAALLQQLVSVTIIDLVTTRNFNFYGDLLELLGLRDSSLQTELSPLYAVACRCSKHEDTWQLKTWMQGLMLGQTLPTLPLWLADNFAVQLELEECYEETCRVLRIP